MSAVAVILVVTGRKEIDVPALFHELSILQKGENGTYSKIHRFLGDARVSIRDYQQMLGATYSHCASTLRISTLRHF